MRRIIIIGYMGAGKTTVGKALSTELNIPFYTTPLTAAQVELMLEEHDLL